MIDVFLGTGLRRITRIYFILFPRNPVPKNSTLNSVQPAYLQICYSVFLLSLSCILRFTNSIFKLASSIFFLISVMEDSSCASS